MAHLSLSLSLSLACLDWDLTNDLIAMGRRREGMSEFEFGFVREVWVHGRRRHRQRSTDDEVLVRKSLFFSLFSY
jgi:hypothetical protein